MTDASGAAPAVLLMGSASNSDAAHRELDELLGQERVAKLASALRAEAEAWAGEVAPGAVYSGDEPVAQVTARVLVEHQGPLLVVWPVLTRFRPELVDGALGDLGAGCELVVAPLIDGGLYLLGLRRPLAELVPVPDHTWASGDAMTAAFAAAVQAGFEVGILRAERALRSPGDVRAALADPLTPREIRAILTGG
jgi:hypothetical protein